jgi:hypothetical protein
LYSALRDSTYIAPIVPELPKTIIPKNPEILGVEIPFLDEDVELIPAFVNIPAVTLMLVKIGDRLISPKVLSWVEENSKFLCYLRIEDIASLLAGYTLDPIFLSEMIKRLVKQLTVPSLCHSFIKQITDLINCYLQVISYIYEYDFPTDDKKLIEKTEEQGYWNLTPSEQSKVDNIESEFLNNFENFLNSLENCIGYLPSFPALITGSCIDNVEEVLDLFSSSINDPQWVEKTINSTEMKTISLGDDILLKAVIEEVSSRWNDNAITSKIKNVMREMFNSVKGQFISNIMRTADGLMISLEPLRRLIDFLKPGIYGSETFLKAIGTMLCVAELFDGGPESIANVMYEELKKALRKVESLSLKAEIEFEGVNAESSDSDYQREVLESQKEYAEDEAAEVGDKYGKIKTFINSMEEELAERIKPIDEMLKGEILKDQYIEKTYWVHARNLTTEMDDTLSPVKSYYFNNVFKKYIDAGISLDRVLTVAKQSFNSPTLTDLMDQMRNILQEESFNNAVKNSYDIESLDLAEKRLEIDNEICLDKIEYVDQKLAELDEEDEAKEEKRKEAEENLAITKIQAEKNKREMLTIEMARSECLAETFILKLTTEAAKSIISLPGQISADLGSFIGQLVASVPGGPSAINAVLENSNIFDAVSQGPIKTAIQPLIDKLIEDYLSNADYEPVC